MRAWLAALCALVCVTGSVASVGSDAAPPPLKTLFPSKTFVVEMSLTRFVANAANDTSVNSTARAVLAIDEDAFQTFLRVDHVGGQVSTSTWSDGVANTSVVQQVWGVKGSDTSGSLCFATPRFHLQDQVATNLASYSGFAGFAKFVGVVNFQGVAARAYNLSSATFYTAVNASNTPIGLWDGKGNVYRFWRWVDGGTAPSAPTACFRIRAEASGGRPQWWKDAGTAAGIQAQDGGVTMLHGNDTYWMFGDTFLKRPSKPCSWPGISNTAMKVTGPGSPTPTAAVSGAYYTGTPADDNGCAWFFADVTKAQWNGAHHRHIWPGGGTTVGNNVAVAWVQVVDDINPGYAVGVSDARGPPAFTLVGATSSGNYTQFPVFSPNVLQYDADEQGYLHLLDFVVPARFSDFNRFARLARVATSDVTDPGAYEFWYGGFAASPASGTVSPTFASQDDMDPLRSPPFLYNVNNPQSSAMFSHALGVYVLFTVDTGQQIYMRTSPWRAGPFSAKIPLYSHKYSADRPGTSIYCSYVHPELHKPLARNITLSFSRNGGGCNFPTPCNDWLLNLSFQS